MSILATIVFLDESSRIRHRIATPWLQLRNPQVRIHPHPLSVKTPENALGLAKLVDD